MADLVSIVDLLAGIQKQLKRIANALEGKSKPAASLPAGDNEHSQEGDS